MLRSCLSSRVGEKRSHQVWDFRNFDSRISHLHSTKCCVGWVMANSYLFLSAWYLNLNVWFLFKEYKCRKIRSPVSGVSSLFTWRNERVYLSDTVLTVSVQCYVMRGDIRRSYAVKTWCNLNTAVRNVWAKLSEMLQPRTTLILAGHGQSVCLDVPMSVDS